MALTDAQKITVFEILEMPYDSSAIEPWGNYNLVGLLRAVENDEQKMQLMIQDKILNLSTAQETRLITYVNEWDAVGVNTTSVDNGSIGGASGLSIDWDNRLRRIQQRVKILIPVLKFRTELENDKNGAVGATIGVLVG